MIMKRKTVYMRTLLSRIRMCLPTEKFAKALSGLNNTFAAELGNKFLECRNLYSFADRPSKHSFLFISSQQPFVS